MESVPRSGDSGISSIIAAVLLLALVVLCVSIVSLLVLQSVQNAAPETLHAQFQASADKNRLYLTGGDVLPIADLIFYDKNGTVISDYVTFPNGGTETNWNSGVWTPGEFITTDANVTLGSIVAKSANGNSVLVYRASGSSASLPTGDMVPDWWSDSEIPVPTTKPTTVPTTDLPTPPEQGNQTDFLDRINTGGHDLTFGSSLGNYESLLGIDSDGNTILKESIEWPPQPDGFSITISIKPKGGNYPYTRVTVSLYRPDTSDPNHYTLASEIPKEYNKMNEFSPKFDVALNDGDVCYVTFMRGESSTDEKAQIQTVKIYIKNP